MWLVAGLAGETSGVLLRIHLGKILWLSRTRRMAAYTKHRSVELCRLHRARIVSMLSQRTVAGFTVDACMLARLLHLRNVGMASFATALTRKVDGASGDIANSRAAVMAIFSEALRYYEVSNHQKNHEGNNK